MEETFGLREIFQIMNRRKILIFIMTVTTTVLVGIYSLFLATPIYQASAEILIGQQNDDLSEYKQTYADFLTNPKLLNSLIQEFKLDCTAEDLEDNIEFTSNEGSAIVSIVVENEDIIQAVRIVNRIVELFEEETEGFGNIVVISKAEVYGDESPVKPNLVFNMVLGFMIGLIAGLTIAFLIEILNTMVRTESDIESKLDLPLLGSVSTFKNKDKNHL